MPLIKAKVSPDECMPHSKRPKAVFIDIKKQYPREKRVQDHTATNMILNETRMNNRVGENDHKWRNNGFQGNVQYVTYFGRAPIRPGEKLKRDLQAPMFPKEDSRPLNTSQMGRAAGKVKQQDISEVGVSDLHKQSIQNLRDFRRTACWHEKNDHAFNYRWDLPKYDPPDISGVNPAGLASIHPAMGTSGSLPDLSVGRTSLAGEEFLDKWRNCTPFAYDAFRTMSWPLPNPPL